MKITDDRARDLLCWLDDQAGDRVHLFAQMTMYRDAAALIRQLQAAEQAAWHAGLDAGREQGGGKDHAQQPPSAPVLLAEAQTAEKETDGEILNRLGDDAQKWAQEFRKTAIQLGYSDMEEGWLVGWFANAIEHSSDTRRWRKEALPPSAPVRVEGVRRYLAARDAKPMHGTDPDVIHTIHTGTEWEAELRVSDLRALAQQSAAVDEATKRDADRYRWLRNCTTDDEDLIIIRGEHGRHTDELLSLDALDAAIDSALAQSGDSDNDH